MFGDYIDLDRRFRTVSEQETQSHERLLGAHFSGDIGWPEILAQMQAIIPYINYTQFHLLNHHQCSHAEPTHRLFHTPQTVSISSDRLEFPQLKLQ